MTRPTQTTPHDLEAASAPRDACSTPRFPARAISTRLPALPPLLAALCTALALALPVTASAPQEARGTIAGTIRDGSGSVIPGATVTIANKEMGTTVAVVTNEVGFLPGALPHPRHLSGDRRAAGLQEIGA